MIRHIVACSLALSALTACGSLKDKPELEQQVVSCALQELAATPGVTDVKLYLPFSAFRPVIGYSAVDQTGKVVRSFVVIEKWSPPDRPVSYDVLFGDSIRVDTFGNRTLQTILSRCGLGIAFRMD